MKPVRGLLVPLLCISLMGCSSGEEGDYAALVDPFIGTGGHGHTYPGASMPFGMVQLSPDTRLTGWDGASGYHFSDEIIYGFSHTHLSGTGVSDYADVLLMPTVGPVRLNNGADEAPGYRSRFRHSREMAEPGYYAVELDDYRIDVELTATRRAGFHRYVFPRNENASVILDLVHRDPIIDSGVAITGDREIAGFRRSSSWARDQHVYFVARFSKPFRDFGVEVDGAIHTALRDTTGTRLKAYVSFATSRDEEVLVKVGISAVSIEGARRNLEAEIPHWDFQRTRAEARQAWNAELSRIEVEGGSRAQRTIFYTALYHTLLNPNLYQDVDGRYRGRDLQVHQADGFENHTVFSLWDTYRATHPLFTLIQQQRTVDFINTFLAQYEQDGLLPVWELAANETGTMIGYHAVPVIADAWLKGIRGYDIAKAFDAMVASAEDDQEGLGPYREFGYIPATEEGESVSKTLEYAYDDWCIAQVARDLGKAAEYERYIRRAQYWKNMLDPQTGFMRARINGSWLDPFDPREVNFHYTEANSWQYSFYVPQDVEGLIERLGGNQAFVEKLDALFDEDPNMTGRRQADITGLIGQYAHGNEPSHHMAYLYSYAGRPWKSQQRVRQILDTMYTMMPDGLSGNEDCGQMSAWYVLSALGFYPVCPGRPEYIIGSPIFPRATIHLENGRDFVIRAKNASSRRPYIKWARLNEETYHSSFLSHETIMQGGEIVLRMQGSPNEEWGADEDGAPRSSIDDHPIVSVPYLTSGERTFRDSTVVALTAPAEDASIFYTLEGEGPTIQLERYERPLTIRGTTTLRAVAVREGMPSSHMIEAHFHELPEGVTIRLNNRYSRQYPAGGDMALIDRIRGPENFRTGSWQGYYGVDLDAVVDLGSVGRINELTTGFLQDVGSWIFMPSEVEYAVSADGDSFQVVGTVENDIPEQLRGAVLKDFALRFPASAARFVRVRAKNRGVCPPWHPGAGNPAWIFADEIVIGREGG
jgi:predicted alpha-1,2-mannosidase